MVLLAVAQYGWGQGFDLVLSLLNYQKLGSLKPPDLNSDPAVVARLCKPGTTQFVSCFPTSLFLVVPCSWLWHLAPHVFGVWVEQGRGLVTG